MLRVRLLGRVAYREALDLQRALQRSSDDYVLVLEHPAVYTAGIRADAANVLVLATMPLVEGRSAAAT